MIWFVLPAKPRRIVKGNKMKPDHRDTVSIRPNGHMLQPSPQTHPLNHGVRKSRQPASDILRDKIESMSTTVSSLVVDNIPRRLE